MAKGVAEIKHEIFETKIREASQNQSKTQTQKSDRKQFRVPSLLRTWIYDKGEGDDCRSR
jgi:hypothetical protein